MGGHNHERDWRHQSPGKRRDAQFQHRRRAPAAADADPRHQPDGRRHSRCRRARLVDRRLLGRDYLSLFDLDLDIPSRRLTLYQPDGCSGRFIPWPERTIAIPLTQPTESALLLQVVVDGVALRALLDTGASASLIAAPGMYRLGLDRAGSTTDPHVQVSGLGIRVTPMARH